jgi:hypothetical protein
MAIGTASIIAALLAGGGSIAGGILGKKGTDKALSAQQAMSEAALELQNDQFILALQANRPFMNLGLKGIGAIEAMIDSGALEPDNSFFEGFEAFGGQEGYQPPTRDQIEQVKGGSTFRRARNVQVQSPEGLGGAFKGLAPAVVDIPGKKTFAEKAQEAGVIGSQDPLTGKVSQPGIITEEDQNILLHGTPEEKALLSSKIFKPPTDPDMQQKQIEAGKKFGQGLDQFGLPISTAKKTQGFVPKVPTTDTFQAPVRPEIAQFQAGQRPDIETFKGESINTFRARPENTFFQQQQLPGMAEISGQAPEQFIAGQAPEFQRFQGGDPLPEIRQPGTFDVTADPGFQFRLEQGRKALEGSAAAKGGALSGAALKELEKFGQGLASEETDRAFGRFLGQEQLAQQANLAEIQRVEKQNALKEESRRFDNIQEYQRYLDNVGIRGQEAQEALSRFQDDRNIKLQQNAEQFKRAMAAQQFGRELSNDEFQKWNAVEGQKFDQMALNRAFEAQRSDVEQARQQQAFETDRAFKTQRADIQAARDIGAFESDRAFGFNQFQAEQAAKKQDFFDQLNVANQAFQRDQLAKQQKLALAQGMVNTGLAATGANIASGANFAGNTGNILQNLGSLQAQGIQNQANFTGNLVNQLGQVAGGIASSFNQPIVGSQAKTFGNLGTQGPIKAGNQFIL